ncbi:hypothetical protein SAMN05878494_2637 [Bacillus cereus]|nr:hypothetical protein SAMN05878494_2637 [Bacillus cereus]
MKIKHSKPPWVYKGLQYSVGLFKILTMNWMALGMVKLIEMIH